MQATQPEPKPRGQRPNRQGKSNLKFSAKNKLAQLTPEQALLLEQWLFSLNYSYQKVKKLCQARFGIKTTTDSLFTFYRKVAAKKIERSILDEVIQANQKGSELRRLLRKHCPGTPEKLYRRTVEIMAQWTFIYSQSETPDFNLLRQNLKTLSDYHREQLIEKKIAFDREQWEFDICEACIKILPVERCATDKPLIPYKERIRAIRMKLFGAAPERVPPLLPALPGPVIDASAEVVENGGEEKPA